MDIDHVYTWVNSQDEELMALRCNYSELEVRTDHAYRSGSVRVDDHGELKASIRNAAKFIPFVRHTYIVGSGSPPEWLDEFDNVTYVDQNTILPEETLPCFQSDLVELYIDRIPGLSEHYIYSNDDYFFASRHQPTDFFDRDGRALVSQAHWVAAGGPRSTYRAMESNAIRALSKRFTLPGFTTGKVPETDEVGRRQRLRMLLRRVKPINAISHVSQPFLKSEWQAFRSIFADDLAPLHRQRFRSSRGLTVNMMYHYFLQDRGRARLGYEPDHVLFKRSDPRMERERFRRMVLARDSKVKRFCLNDEIVEQDNEWSGFVSSLLSDLLGQNVPSPREIAWAGF